MTVSPMEIIDLTTDSPSQYSRTLAPEKSLRRQKSAPGETILGSNSPIVISDGEAAPSSSVPSASDLQGKKRRSRKKERKVTNLEEGEVVAQPNAGGLYSLSSSGNTTPQNRDTCQPHIRLPAGRSSSPQLFYLDDKPDNVQTADGANDAQDILTAVNTTKPDSLLLPGHVTLDAAPRAKEAVEVTDGSMGFGSDTDDFIHYADAELNIFRRYYEEPRGESERKAHLVCGQCGAEGDHKQADCPVVVCLTCGAHNEHSTRQCPIVKTCFSCGMKGHINRDCPNKHASTRLIDRDYECNRCGSDLHKTRECPTLWRVYEYVDDVEREAILKSRKKKENLPIGQGGEGYIGEGYWCYNCGGEGHLGDDCKVELRHTDSREPSAFGSFNTMSGPFADREHARSDRHRLQREWELNGNFDDGHGFSGPSDVGKRGRDREREQMRRREKEIQELDDDEGDWFGSRQSKTARRSPLGAGDSGHADERVVFKFRNGGRNNKDRRLPADRLLDRISSGRMGEKRRTRGENRKRSVSPRFRRQAERFGADGHSKDDGEGESERVRRQNRDRQRDRDRDLLYPDSRGDSYRSNGENGGWNTQRMGRQYYGGYAR